MLIQNDTGNAMNDWNIVERGFKVCTLQMRYEAIMRIWCAWQKCTSHELRKVDHMVSLVV